MDIPRQKENKLDISEVLSKKVQIDEMNTESEKLASISYTFTIKKLNGRKDLRSINIHRSESRFDTDDATPSVSEQSLMLDKEAVQSFIQALADTL